jgi:hypothetical protein
MEPGRPPVVSRPASRIAIDLVFGLIAVALELFAGLYTLVFVLMTPVLVMKPLMALTWLAGLILVLWVLLTRGWPAIVAAIGMIAVLVALGSIAQSIQPVYVGP